MALYRIADLNIKINNKYNYTTKLCADYLHKDQSQKADFEVTPSMEDYESDKEFLKGYPDSYLESISIYRQIARNILNYNGIIMHACIVEMNGKGYAFSAPSGTGKSTHAKLWLEVFGDKALIVNGDKPLLRFIDGTLYAYGTPWCGKEAYNINTKVRLDNICFLSRGAENKIKKITCSEAIPRIFTQLLLPQNNEQTDNFFNMLNIIFDKVNFYSLECNMNPEAAKVSFEGMNNEK